MRAPIAQILIKNIVGICWTNMFTNVLVRLHILQHFLLARRNLGEDLHDLAFAGHIPDYELQLLQVVP